MPAGILTGGAFGYLSDYVLWWVLLISVFVHTWCFFRFFPRDVHRKLGLVLGNALVFCSMLGVAAMIGESYLRFVYVGTDAFGVSLPAQRWFAIHTRLNSLGCRDREWERAKPPGVRRMAFVGDSFTYGWGIEDVEDRFPDRVGAALRKRLGSPIEVLNVAKPGWGTGDEIRPVRDMIDIYDVDEIVLCYVPNDIEKLLPRSADFDPTKPPPYGFFDPDSSPLLDHLYRRFYLPFVPTVHRYHDWIAAGYADESIWKKHQEQLREIVGTCRASGVTLRVVLLPFLRTTGDRYAAAAVHHRLRSFFESNAVPVADLLPVIVDRRTADLVVNSLDAHPNELAHKLFADAIVQAMWGR